MRDWVLGMTEDSLRIGPGMLDLNFWASCRECGAAISEGLMVAIGNVLELSAGVF